MSGVCVPGISHVLPVVRFTEDPSHYEMASISMEMENSGSGIGNGSG